MRRRALATLALLTLLAGATLGIGCGAVMHTGVIMGANGAFEEARLAGAERYAPYEFYRAREYLAKAREEAGYSDFEAAIKFARVAKAASARALEKSRMHKGGALGHDSGDD